MDAPGASDEQLRRSLRFIRRVNAALGYTRATLSHFDRFSRSWRRGETIRVVDVGTGSADIPLALLRWAERRGFDLRVVGVDLHPTTAAIAAEARHPKLRIVRGDALCPPFAANSFDYAITNMFLHHLPDAAATAVLRQLDRLACRGVLVADLLRRRRAYAWISLFTLASNPMVRHDARVSVRQAFSPAEVLKLRNAAGLAYVRYYPHFGHRFVLAGEKDVPAATFRA